MVVVGWGGWGRSSSTSDSHSSAIRFDKEKKKKKKKGPGALGEGKLCRHVSKMPQVFDGVATRVRAVFTLWANF